MQALQLSQAAKALAQSVAAAFEKDREAGMGLPRQVAAAMTIMNLCCLLVEPGKIQGYLHCCGAS